MQTYFDSVAQLVEHIPFKDGVLGSNPSWITKHQKELVLIPFFMLNKSMYTLYILHSKSLDKYYVGYINDLTRRLNEHNRIKGKFTDVGIPWVLVYKETYVLLPSEVIFHLSDLIVGLAASPNEADSLI